MADMNAILEKNIALYNGRSLNCAETVLASMCEYMGVESALVPRIATAFGGGMGGTQSVCGTVTGALMALGIWAGREPGGDQAPARARRRSASRASLPRPTARSPAASSAA